MRQRCGAAHFSVSLTHLDTELVRAAPDSFLSSATLSQVVWTSGVASVTHFLTKLFFAALVSFLAAAW